MLYTDGVTEAFNADGEAFDAERLSHMVRTHRTASAQELLKAIKAEVAVFTGGVPRSDDIALLVVRCQPLKLVRHPRA